MMMVTMVVIMLGVIDKGPCRHISSRAPIESQQILLLVVQLLLFLANFVVACWCWPSCMRRVSRAAF